MDKFIVGSVYATQYMREAIWSFVYKQAQAKLTAIDISCWICSGFQSITEHRGLA